MKGMKENIDYIDDIIDSIDKINQFTINLELDDFIKDVKTNYAVVRCFEIMGEATNNLSEDIKLKYNKIPWKIIYNTRNVIAHAYDKIKLKIIWKTIKDEERIVEISKRN